jgi:hypothetical protein
MNRWNKAALVLQLAARSKDDVWPWDTTEELYTELEPAVDFVKRRYQGLKRTLPMDAAMRIAQADFLRQAAAEEHKELVELVMFLYGRDQGHTVSCAIGYGSFCSCGWSDATRAVLALEGK